MCREDLTHRSIRQLARWLRPSETVFAVASSFPLDRITSRFRVCKADVLLKGAIERGQYFKEI